MFTLIQLPYKQDALAPYMSQETIEYHYGKHHQAYVTNLNKLLETSPLQGKSLEEIIKASHNQADKKSIFNNAGQIYNHNIFWHCMKPNGGGVMPTTLQSKIEKDFGSAERFKEEFITKGVGQFGSGWVWLVLDIDTKTLHTEATPNGEPPLAGNKHPLLACDVWEHSYYIDYRNARQNYLSTFLDKLVNWDYVVTELDKHK